MYGKIQDAKLKCIFEQWKNPGKRAYENEILKE
mgnify:CR=1 FL=1